MLDMRRQQVAWDDSAKCLAFYMYVFIFHGGTIYTKYWTEKTRRGAELVQPNILSSRLFLPIFFEDWVNFGQLWLQNCHVWQVTNPARLTSKWELRTKPFRKLQSSEAPLPLLQWRRDVPILLPLSFAGKLIWHIALAVIEITGSKPVSQLPHFVG